MIIATFFPPFKDKDVKYVSPQKYCHHHFPLFLPNECFPEYLHVWAAGSERRRKISIYSKDGRAENFL